MSRIPRLSRLPVMDGPDASIEDPFISSVAQDSASSARERNIQVNHEGMADSGDASISRSRTKVALKTPRGGAENTSSSSEILPARRRPRPSLSDRTAETLAQIPSTVSPKRRRSSFFQSGNTLSSPVRPATFTARARPSTSMGLRPPIPDFSSSVRASSPVKQRLAPTAGNRLPPKTPVKTDTGRYVPRSLPPSRPGVKEAVPVTPSRQKTPVTSIRFDNHRPAFR